MTIKELITTFDNMIQSASKIYNFIEEEQDGTGRQYIGASVTVKMPNGSKRKAIITEIEWCPSCGLKGNWMIYVKYLHNTYTVTPEGKKKLATAPGAWVTREVLQITGAKE